MKKILLILFLALSYSGLSFAGADDRDQEQELLLDSLNTESEYIDISETGTNQKQSIQGSENSTANLEQLLKEIEEDLKEISELEDETSVGSFTATFKENYIDSFSGRFILLGVIALFLFVILLYSTFFSKK